MKSKELILRLKIELDTMMTWAAEVSDEYLDSDPENRAMFVADMREAKEAMRIEASDV